MNTRRFPRTMDEAFGAYQRSSQCVVHPMPEITTPKERNWQLAQRVIYILAAVAVIVIYVTR